MIEVQRGKSLLRPKIIDISKDKYQQFHQVRKLQSSLLGTYYLYSAHHKKYIGKQLHKDKEFLTSRPSSMPIYRYNCQDKPSLYLFPLVGEPLMSIKRKKQYHQEIQLWIDRCGSMEESLNQVIKLSLKNYDQYGIEDIILECFRVYEGRLMYIYDSWMNSSYECVRACPMEIQHYFLSEENLKNMRNGSKGVQSCSFKDTIFKIGLMILNLGTHEVKSRKYEYCEYKLNKFNIQEQLQLLTNKFKAIYYFVEKFIHYKIQTMKDLWRITSMEKSQKTNKVQKNKENQSLLASTVEGGEKIRLSLKPLHQRKSSNFTSGSKNMRKKQTSTSVIFAQSFENSYIQPDLLHKEEFNIKKRLSLCDPDECIKILSFLDLTEYLPQNQYEKKVLSTLENIHVKSQWVRKSYSNGSLYFGQVKDNVRNGKGMYLFQSDDLYIGQWTNNQIHGSGTYVFKSGQIYAGEFINGEKHGFGKFQYKDGKIYEGYWKNNSKYGLGTFIFPNNVKFFGIFNPGIQLTEGIFTRIEGEQILQYNGSLENYQWQKNEFKSQMMDEIKKKKLSRCKIDAYGILKDQKGQVYSGQHKEGKANGFGIKEGIDEIYEGMWKDNKEHGEGKLHITNKFMIEGVWHQGFLRHYKPSI